MPNKNDPAKPSPHRLTGLYIWTFIVCGCSASLGSAVFWDSGDPWRFLTYLTAAVLSSSLKIHLPGIKGTMSVNFLFILLATVELTWSETVAVSVLSFVLQYVWRSR